MRTTMPRSTAVSAAALAGANTTAAQRSASKSRRMSRMLVDARQRGVCGM
jgi:hypothetical protein